MEVSRLQIRGHYHQRQAVFRTRPHGLDQPRRPPVDGGCRPQAWRSLDVGKRAGRTEGDALAPEDGTMQELATMGPLQRSGFDEGA
jgi:hypothetical protein